MIAPLKNASKLYGGSIRLPAGAVPLASDQYAGIVCLMPSGRWVRWWPTESLLQTMAPETQSTVMSVLIGHFGGTAATMALRLGVSVRTVEGWRSGRARLPIKPAYKITQALSNPAD